MRLGDRDRVDVGGRVVEADDDDLVVGELPLERLRQRRVHRVPAEAGRLRLLRMCFRRVLHDGSRLRLLSSA